MILEWDGGGYCKAAQMMGLTVYGIEVTQNQVEYAKSQGLKVISWDEIPNYNFSIINSEQVMEHVDNPFSIIQHLLKGLSPEGLIRISVPKGENVKCTLSKKPKTSWFTSKGAKYSLNPIEPLQHLNSFTNNSRIKMMALLGLKPIKSPFGNLMINSIGTYSITNMVKSAIKELHLYQNDNKDIFIRK